jgi:hypothetical protein
MSSKLPPIARAMLRRSKPLMSPVPNTCEPIKPPTRAPPIPSTIVIKMPPGARPGNIQRAMKPAINPNTIQARIPTAPPGNFTYAAATRRARHAPLSQFSSTLQEIHGRARYFPATIGVQQGCQVGIFLRRHHEDPQKLELLRRQPRQSPVNRSSRHLTYKEHFHGARSLGRQRDVGLHVPP